MKLNLDEIDRELMRLPASPTTPEDITERASLTLKRFELEAAAREAEASRSAAARREAWGFPLANVPGDISCVITAGGRTVYAEIVDGIRMIRLTAHEVRQLSISKPAWGDLNPKLLT